MDICNSKCFVFSFSCRVIFTASLPLTFFSAEYSQRPQTSIDLWVTCWRTVDEETRRPTVICKLDRTSSVYLCHDTPERAWLTGYLSASN